LRLETPADSASAVKRATKFEEGAYRSSFAKFVAIGRGDVESGEAGTDTLQRVDLFWVSNAICADNFRNYNLTPNQICFSGEEANDLKAGTCQGDSGGPIYWVDNGDFKQVGITSFGPDPCGSIKSRVTAAYTEVADYESWISSVLSGELNDKPTAESTKEARDAYFATNGRVIFQGGTVSSGGGDGGGGGAWSWLLSLSLISLGWLRRRVFA
jgi:secreted trypsin-like serine protease